MRTLTADAALISGLQARREQAVADLVDRYWTRAYRLAYQLTGDPGAAEDVAQETLVAALEGVGKLQADDPFPAWLFRILERTARKHHRSRGRRGRHEREAAGRRPEAGGDSPAQASARAEEAELVRRHLTRLSPKLRHALALRYLEDMSLEDVARALEIPRKTVSSRIRRGLEALRDSLQPSLSLSLVELGWLQAALQVEAPQPPSAVEIVGGAAAPPGSTPASPAPAELLRRSGALAARPLLAWVLGGLALAGLGLASLAQLLAPDADRPAAQVAFAPGAAEQARGASPAGPALRGGSGSTSAAARSRPGDEANRAGASPLSPPGPAHAGAPARAEAPRKGTFSVHYQQGYSFAEDRVVPAEQADVVFASCSGGCSTVTLEAPGGIASLDGWGLAFESAHHVRLWDPADVLPFPRLAVLAAMRGFDPAAGRLAQSADGSSLRAATDVFVLRTRSGAWAKLAIVLRQRGIGEELPEVAVSYELQPERPVFGAQTGRLQRFRGFLLDPQPLLDALQDPDPFRHELERQALARNQRFLAAVRRWDAEFAARFPGAVPPGASLGWVWRRDRAVQAGALADPRYATYGFEHASRDGTSDFLFDARGELSLDLGRDDRSQGWDLGPGSLEAPLPSRLPQPQNMLEPQPGCRYLIHTYRYHPHRDGWVLLQVLALEEGRLVFAWKALADGEGLLRLSTPPEAVMRSPVARLQLRSGVCGRDRCVGLDPTRCHVDALRDQPLDLTSPIAPGEGAHGYVEGGLIPPGMVWVVDSIELRAAAPGHGSASPGGVALYLGALCVARLEGTRLSLVTGEQVERGDPREPVTRTLRCQVVLQPGEESSVCAAIEKSSQCDVVLRGRFLPAAEAPAPPLPVFESEELRTLRKWVDQDELYSPSSRDWYRDPEVVALVRVMLSFGPQQPRRARLEALLACASRRDP